MKYSENLPTSEQFYKLFETTGWNDNYELSAEELYTALKNSWYTISIIDNDQLIGFGRIIGDGVVHALILDCIIQPDKQGEGIGKKITEKLVSKCKKHKIRDIQLFSAKGKAGFYEKQGFEKRKDDSPGMGLKKYW
ncbi:MAG: GNAT family N-acetyltransferase [Bacteroidales bacterium]|jgi:N-acetylglutamate synthase-like GNAT family acetyltransferase|nr:GNAT family N-acetyltransferase [Bacteroidales bacterium]